jgi:hypothetical protein
VRSAKKDLFAFCFSLDRSIEAEKHRTRDERANGDRMLESRINCEKTEPTVIHKNRDSLSNLLMEKEERGRVDKRVRLRESFCFVRNRERERDSNVSGWLRSFENFSTKRFWRSALRSIR